MKEIFDLEKRDFVLLDINDYIKLTQLARMNSGGKPTMIKTSDLFFLSALMKELSVTHYNELSIMNDTVTIKVRKDDGSEINSTFDLKLCENYYNRVNKFISEVL